MFSHFKRGGVHKVLPCLEGVGGAQKVSNPQFSHFVAPPPPRMYLMTSLFENHFCCFSRFLLVINFGLRLEEGKMCKDSVLIM